MPGQAEDLVAKIQAHPDIDVENDWKLVSLFIGGNDLCGACRRVSLQYVGVMAVRTMIDCKGHY